MTLSVQIWVWVHGITLVVVGNFRCLAGGGFTESPAFEVPAGVLIAGAFVASRVSADLRSFRFTGGWRWRCGATGQLYDCRMKWVFEPLIPPSAATRFRLHADGSTGVTHERGHLLGLARKGSSRAGVGPTVE